MLQLVRSVISKTYQIENRKFSVKVKNNRFADYAFLYVSKDTQGLHFVIVCSHNYEK